VTATVVPHDGFAFGAFSIVAVIVLILLILAYRIMRGESLTYRTRLGVFLERDRYPDEEPEEPGEPAAEVRELDPGDY
jgi:hypothetical protein